MDPRQGTAVCPAADRRKNDQKRLDKFFLCAIIISVVDAALAHPVERHLAKVEVASSSLVSRSTKSLLRLQ